VLSNCTLIGNSGPYRYHTFSPNVIIGGGGGAHEGTLYNCMLIGNSGGGAFDATLHNCTLTGNSGSGAYGGTLYNCTLTGNRAYGYGEYGGGARGGTLYNCTLSGNEAYYGGGGAHGSTLYSCTLSGNWSMLGGGTYGGTLYNCTIAGNWGHDGGGAYGGTLKNCTLFGNSAYNGGGAYRGRLYNCTVSDNSADYHGGGAVSGALNNCIVYYNTAPSGPNVYDFPQCEYSCTTPDPGGPGNITNAPLFADRDSNDFHLMSMAGRYDPDNDSWVMDPTNSPCIDMGDPSSSCTNESPWNGGRINMGAYGNTPEASRSADSDGDGLSDTLESFAFGANPYNADTDGDGSSDWAECRAGTCLTNPASQFMCANAVADIPAAASASTGTAFVIRWTSESGQSYAVQRSSSVAGPYTTIATGIDATPPINTYTNISAAARCFCRVMLLE